MENKAVKKLLKMPCFNASQAKAAGIAPQLLAYYVNKGVFERTTKGFYKNPNFEGQNSFEWEDLLSMSQSIPGGVICATSALNYFGLTNEVQRVFTIAVPNDSSKIKRPMTKIIRMRNIELGKIPLNIDGYRTFIFNRERCVVDAFKYLSKDSAINTLKMYLEGSDDFKADIQTLTSYARELRVHIKEYLEVLL